MIIRGEVAMDFQNRYGILYMKDGGARQAQITAEVVAAHRQQSAPPTLA